MTDDTELLRRYAEEKSDEAFGELVRRHIDFVYAAALRQARGNAPLAQDVTQMVFTDLARKAVSLARHEVIVGWLHTATRFAVTKAIRGESRRQAREQEAFVMNEALGEAEASVDWERLHPVLDEVLGELKERERAAILLRFFEKKPLAEVGARLSLSEDAARSCVDRALDKMHGLLSRRGVTSTSAALAVALTNQVGVAAPAGLASSVSTAALAGAVGVAGVGGVANLFLFMSTTKTIAGISGVIALLAVGTAVFEAKVARDSGAEQTVIGRERDALRGDVQQMTARVRDAERAAGEAVARNVAMQKTIEASRAAAASSARVAQNPAAFDPAAAKIAQSNAEKQQLKILNMTNPDFQRLMLQSEKAGMSLRYGALYKNLGLTPQQIASFEGHMVEARQSVMDVLNVANEKGVSPSDPAMVALANQAKTTQDERLRALLGEAGFQEFRAYDRSSAAREMVGRMIGGLVGGETPLTLQQLNGLTQIIAANNAMFQKGGNASGNLRDVNWDAALEQAKAVLSPEQLGVVQAMRDQTKAAAQAEDFARELANAQMRPSGGGAAPPAMPPKS